MSKLNYSKLVEEKISELKSAIASVKTSDKLTKNTRGTQLYKLGRERRILHLVDALLSQIQDVKLSDADMDTFVLITTLATERAARSTIEVHEGDNILGLLQKYQDVKNIQEKLNKACEKEGLFLDYASGEVAKALTK